jgi:hypothetical protein
MICNGRITLRTRQLHPLNGAKPAVAILYKKMTISGHPRSGRLLVKHCDQASQGQGLGGDSVARLQAPSP